MNRTILKAENSQDLYQQAAGIIAEKARQAIQDRGRFTFAVSGGSSVKALALLAEEPDIDWSKVYLFWADDRFVESTNPYSNYRAVEEALLTKLAGRLSASNVFPIPADAPNPAEGARRYSQVIREFFGLAPGEWPQFDLALNGMGPDGHTASLFPHSSALEETGEIAAMNHAGLNPWVDRVTLTFPVFNHARCVLFLASGAEKAGMLKNILEGEPNVRQWPSQGIQPENGELIWLVDSAIAAQLN